MPRQGPNLISEAATHLSTKQKIGIGAGTIILAAVLAVLNSSGNIIWNNFSAQNDMPVCGERATLTGNYSPTDTLTDVNMRIHLANGVSYIPGTAVFSGGATLVNEDVTDPRVPVFTLTDATGPVSFLMDRTASCEAYNTQLSGGQLVDTAKVFSEGSQVASDEISNAYSLQYATLGVSDVQTTPNIAEVGDTVTREITITNGNFGARSSFYFGENIGPGDLDFFDFIINPTTTNYAIPAGQLSTNGRGDTVKVLINETAITQIGDGNSLFENGESFTLQYKAVIFGCGAGNIVSSFPTAFWGCGEEVCQAASIPAGISLTPDEANLIVRNTAVTTACYGYGNEPDTLFMEIENNGPGAADNLYIRITTSTHSYGGFDSAQISYSIDGEAYQKLSFTSAAKENDIYGCHELSTGTPLFNSGYLTLPEILPGGSKVMIKMAYYKCAPDICFSEIPRGDIRPGHLVTSWVDYTNICGENPKRSSRGIINRKLTFKPIYATPPTVLNGSSERIYIDWSYLSFGNIILDEATAYFELTVNFPDKIDLDGDSSVINWLKTDRITSFPMTEAAVTDSGFTAKWLYSSNNGSNNFRATQITFPITTDCSEIGTDKDISYSFTFFPSSASACTDFNGLNLTCRTDSIQVVCPGACHEGGTEYVSYSLERANLGDPDMDNNGCPDNDNLCDGTGVSAGIPVDYSLMRTDKAIARDTLLSSAVATVRTSPTNPDWPYLYMENVWDNATLITPTKSFLKIVDISTGNTSYSCTSIPNVLTDNTYTFDLSPGSLSTCLGTPPSFVLEEGDSIYFDVVYRIADNLGSDGITSLATDNLFYTAATPSPTLLSEKFECIHLGGAVNATQLNGYFCCNWKKFKDCQINNNNDNHNMRLNNDGTGNNFFPYEYRQLARPIKKVFTVPPGFKFDHANFRMRRTAGNGVSSSSSYYPIVPTSTSLNGDGSTILTFDLTDPANSGMWVENGGTIYYSDDTFTPESRIFISPTCQAPSSWSNNGGLEFHYELPGGSAFIDIGNTHVTYDAPDIVITSSSQTQIVKSSNLVSWDFQTANRSPTSKATNTWVYLSSPQGSMGGNTLELRDGSGTLLTPDANGFFQLGELATSASENFSLTADYTSCDLDSMVVYTGWNCTGYPTSLADYPCTPEELSLRIKPVQGRLSTSITPLASTPADPANPSAGTFGDNVIDMCEAFPVELTLVSAQEGGLSDVEIFLNNALAGGSPGLEYIANSATLEYPQGTTPRAFDAAAEASLQGNNGGPLFQFDLSQIDPPAFSGGAELPGTDSTAEKRIVTIRILLKANCDFASGDAFSVRGFAESGCGELATGSSEIVPSQNIEVRNVSGDYAVGFTLPDPVEILHFQNTQLTEISMTKYGANPVGPLDVFSMSLPPDVVIASWEGCLTGPCPDNGRMNSQQVGNQMVYTWETPTLADGETSTFRVRLAYQQRQCGTLGQISMSALSSTALTCADEPSGACPSGASLVLGSTTAPVVANLPKLAISFNSGQTYLDEGVPVNERYRFEMNTRITNQGGPSIEPIQMEFYCVEKGQSYSDGSPPVAAFPLSSLTANETRDTLISFSSDYCDPRYYDLIGMIPDTSFDQSAYQCFCEEPLGISSMGTQAGPSPFDFWESQVSVLEVEWKSFQASWKRNTAELIWETERELQVNFFQVERSLDGRNYESITQVDPKGSDEQGASYAFQDASAASLGGRTVYYRIKEFDMNGGTSLSQIRKVEIPDTEQQFQLTVSPNPATSYATISYQAAPSAVSLQVFDLSGKPLLSRSNDDLSGSFELDVQNWPTGIYLLDITTSGYREVKKLQVTKVQ